MVSADSLLIYDLPHCASRENKHTHENKQTDYISTRRRNALVSVYDKDNT